MICFSPEIKASGSNDVTSRVNQHDEVKSACLWRPSCITSKQQVDKFRRGIGHGVIGLDCRSAVHRESVHAAEVLVEGVEHALNVLFRIRLLELDEAAQQKGPGRNVQHDHQRHTRDGNDEQGLPANRHQGASFSYCRSLGFRRPS